jgi:hypothetical protein
MKITAVNPETRSTARWSQEEDYLKRLAGIQFGNRLAVILFREI